MTNEPFSYLITDNAPITNKLTKAVVPGSYQAEKRVISKRKLFCCKKEGC